MDVVGLGLEYPMDSERSSSRGKANQPHLRLLTAFVPDAEEEWLIIVGTPDQHNLATNP